jgi:hypothetical protein
VTHDKMGYKRGTRRIGTHISPRALMTLKPPVLIRCADAQAMIIADDCRRRRVGSKGAASTEPGS